MQGTAKNSLGVNKFSLLVRQMLFVGSLKKKKEIKVTNVHDNATKKVPS